VKQLCSTVALFACASLLSSSLAYGQGTLQQVKSLYASAAYEDALSVVTQLLATKRNIEFEQYRVFCLVALGRTAEAEKAITSVVVEDPSFVPDVGETSPRIQEMFQRIRRGLVPEIAQRMYLDARAAMEQKDRATASARFAALVRLIDSAAASDSGGEATADSAEPMLSELRLLASGFLDLNRALPEVKPAIGPEAVKPPVTVAPVNSAAVTSPVPVRQDLPVWVPPDLASRREFRGTLRVFVSDTGRVTGAEVASTIHPAYDRQLLLAAKSWEYQPALKNGTPVPSEKLIEVVLRPR
jgi:periplasmic protein TonB